MEAEFDGSDYYIYITSDEGRRISIPINKKMGRNFFPLLYDWLDGNIKSELPMDAYLFLTCSNDCRQVSAPGRITLDREDDKNPKDVTVRIFTGEMLNLLENKIPYIMTRYDRENKIWVYLEE